MFDCMLYLLSKATVNLFEIVHLYICNLRVTFRNEGIII